MIAWLRDNLQDYAIASSGDPLNGLTYLKDNANIETLRQQLRVSNATIYDIFELIEKQISIYEGW